MENEKRQQGTIIGNEYELKGIILSCSEHDVYGNLLKHEKMNIIIKYDKYIKVNDFLFLDDKIGSKNVKAYGFWEVTDIINIDEKLMTVSVQRALALGNSFLKK